VIEEISAGTVVLFSILHPVS